MRRFLFRFVLFTLIAVLALCVFVFLSLKKGGALERRLSAMVERTDDEHFAFNGIIAGLDVQEGGAGLYLRIIEPEYSRGDILVSADSVMLAPDYKAILSGEPVIKLFAVSNGRLKKGVIKLEELEIAGSAPRIKGGLELKGDLVGNLAGLPLGDAPVVVKGKFGFSPGGLKFPQLSLLAGSGEAKGFIVESRASDGSSTWTVDIDFGKEGPAVRYGSDFSIVPTGRLNLVARTGGPETSVHLPMKDLGLLIRTPRNNYDIRVTAGLVDLQGNSLVIEDIAVKVADNAAFVLGGGAGDLGKPGCHGTLSCRGKAIPLAVIAGFLPAGKRALAANLPPSCSFDIQASVSGSRDNLKGFVNLLPHSLALSLPVGNESIPARLEKGGVSAKIFSSQGRLTVHSRIDPPALVKIAGALLSVSGSINDLTRTKTVDLKISGNNISVTTLLAGLPKKLRVKLGAVRKSLFGKIDSLAVHASGTADNPAITGWIDLTGVNARHSSLKGRVFQVVSGRISGSTAGAVTWDNLKINLGPVSVRSGGKIKRTGDKTVFSKDSFFKGYVPLGEIPSLLGMKKDIAITGKAYIDGTLSGRLTDPTISGGVKIPGKSTLSLLGAKQPFLIDWNDLKAAWNYEQAKGLFHLASLKAGLAKGTVSGSATLAVASKAPLHSFKVGFNRINLNTLIARGARIDGLLSGRVILDLKGTISGKTGMSSLNGSGLLKILDPVINGSKLMKITKWDKYLPLKKKKHKHLGDAILHAFVEVVAENTRELQPVIRLRDGLHASYNFGKLTAPIKMSKGVVQMEPVVSEGAPSRIEGVLRINMSDLAMNGMFSARLVHPPDKLTAEAIALKGTMSAPEFKLTRSFDKTFRIRKWKKK